MKKIFRDNGRAFIVPVDDLLICGPNGHLEEYETKISAIKNSPVNAVLGFPGMFSQFFDELSGQAWIINLTTSTKLTDHTNKKLAVPLRQAIYCGCDAVAAHVNMTSHNEGEMIQNLGLLSYECQAEGIPLMAIMYVRKANDLNIDDNYEKLKRAKNEEYTKMVCHACRVAVELGVDLIKTNFTGSSTSFEKVVRAAGDVPVLVAGGDLVSEDEIIKNAREAIKAGASGVCFGRNFFYRNHIREFIDKVDEIINNG
jgi:DhnA family fructose-bisphosphate aldolase class Ia